MAFSGFDHRLLGALRRADVTWSRTYVLQRVLRAVSGTTLFSRHVAAVSGVAGELPRLQGVLANFADTAQPRASLLRALCAGADEAVGRAMAQWGDEPVLVRAHRTVSGLVAALDDPAGHTPSRWKDLALTAAADLDGLAPHLRRLVERRFDTAWAAPDGEFTPAGLDLVADEVACLVAAADRDPHTLAADLAGTHLSGTHLAGAGDAASVRRVLLPVPVRYRVAVVVHGASTLARISALDPTAAVSSFADVEPLGFGATGGRLRAFAGRVATPGQACLVACEVRAVDEASAARAARRALSELLDQYAAGHRLVVLAPGPAAFVSAVDSGKSGVVLPRRQSVDRAEPLVPGWPSALRGGLRMAHVARTTEAAMPATALAWVTLEACGLENRADLASALSLQALRQQVAETHQQLHQAAAEVLGDARARAGESRRRVVALRRALERCPQDHPDHAGLRARADRTERELVAAQRHERLVEEQVGEGVRLLGRYARCDGFGRLLDLNTWVDVLLPGRPEEDPALTTARTALDGVVAHTSPLASHQVEEWSTRLADPRACAAWLEESRRRTALFLDTLYVVRNVAFHSGRFRTAGDVALAAGASLAVDFALEVLGNWYRTSPGSAASPSRVVSALADRQRAVVSRLGKRAKPLYALDVARLTGPDDDVWHRQS
ncbi:hypothetical protein ABZ816_02540 [Actinosynnema sp. NPDC047251]|uniref:hypothetical protein n=1 Tax=Saccharothrix espanaensis TaxID=103731 RepID=UPI0002FE2BFD|nr:hypothetical protein [Saccharothrix espanaensis]